MVLLTELYRIPISQQCFKIKFIQAIKVFSKRKNNLTQFYRPTFSCEGAVKAYLVIITPLHGIKFIISLDLGSPYPTYYKRTFKTFYCVQNFTETPIKNHGVLEIRDAFVLNYNYLCIIFPSIFVDTS